MCVERCHLARDYRSDLKSWLQTDQYMDPWSDVALSLDPTTRDRHGYAGANPVGSVDVDGHRKNNTTAGEAGCAHNARCSDEIENHRPGSGGHRGTGGGTYAPGMSGGNERPTWQRPGTEGASLVYQIAADSSLDGTTTPTERWAMDFVGSTSVEWQAITESCIRQLLGSSCPGTDFTDRDAIVHTLQLASETGGGAMFAVGAGGPSFGPAKSKQLAAGVALRGVALERSVAELIEARHPGRIVNTNVKRGGREFDIELNNVIIEVTGGKGTRKMKQHFAQMAASDKPVILYGPNLREGLIRDINRQGGIATNSIDDLLEAIY